MTENICRLCYEKKTHPLAIFMEEGVELKIAEIIRKHFPDEVLENDDLLPKFVCVQCWAKLADFHEFYKAVDVARNAYFNNRVKEEVPNFIEINCDGFIGDVPLVKNEPICIDVNDLKPPPPEKRQNENKYGLTTSIAFDSNNHDGESIECGEEFESKCDFTFKEISLEPASVDEAFKRETDQLETDELCVKCALCKHPLRTPSEAHSHYRTQHSENTQDRQKLTCCGRRLYPHEMSSHAKYHLNRDAFKCTECGNRFITPSNLRQHRLIHRPKKFVCDICQTKFVNRNNMKEHILRMHTKVKQHFKCEICNKRAGSKAGLVSHQQKHVLKQCDICMKSFAKLCLLKDHILLVHAAKKTEFKCTHCGKCFASDKLRHSHVQKVHERRYHRVCHICARVYSSYTALRTHLQEHSEVGKPKIKCHICGKMYKHLETHMYVHKDEGKAFPCPYCAKIFRNRNVLSSHVTGMHTFKLKKCHLCDKKYKTNAEMREHVATHTGEYLYDCAYCSLKFKFRSSQYQHKKRHHPAEWKAERSRSLQLKNE